jgi:hypothetical protein
VESPGRAGLKRNSRQIGKPTAAEKSKGCFLVQTVIRVVWAPTSPSRPRRFRGLSPAQVVAEQIARSKQRRIFPETLRAFAHGAGLSTTRQLPSLPRVEWLERRHSGDAR